MSDDEFINDFEKAFAFGPDDTLYRIIALARIGAAVKPDYVMVQADVITFLRGEGALDGFWFGDTIPAGEKKPYWWRRYLHTPKSTGE